MKLPGTVPFFSPRSMMHKTQTVHLDFLRKSHAFMTSIQMKNLLLHGNSTQLEFKPLVFQVENQATSKSGGKVTELKVTELPTYFLTTNLILLLPRTILSRRGIPNHVGLRKGIPSGKPSTYKYSGFDSNTGQGTFTASESPRAEAANEH